jgi:putative ABC transport system permease protein
MNRLWRSGSAGYEVMKLQDISLNNLRRRKAKMIFLVLGLVIAVSTVVTLITVSAMMNADIATKLDEFGANILIVPKSDDLSLTYGGMSISGVSFDVRDLHENDARLIRTIKNKDNIRIIAPKLLNAAKVQKKDVLVVGVDFDAEVRLKKWWSIVGKKPDEPRDALIGSDAKSKLQLGLNHAFEINGETFRVSGVLEPTGSQDDGIIFVPLKEAQRLFRKQEQLSLIELAALCYDCPIEEIVRQTSEKLPGARVMAIRQTIESKMEAMHRFEHFSLGISIVMLFVGALIVFTNMTASVNERTREIGVFRAIGFRQTHIMRIILTEAFVTSFVAGVAGYFVGFGISKIVTPMLTMGGGLAITVNYLLLGFSIALAVVVGLASSIYPAFKASRLDPTVALRAL